MLDILKRNKRGYIWITLAFFIVSLTIHWTFAWFAYVQDQEEHNQPVETIGYFNQTMRDTMENWQSEFLQLMWQVGGLSFLLYVGSPQSKESSDRVEAKIDLLINNLKEIAEDPERAKALVNTIDNKYYKNS
ncbi:MAG TPA: DUF6766 family protein [Nitrososphaera sp.]|nr:DUF6766 family protein [Nitrososphaera sp.]